MENNNDRWGTAFLFFLRFPYLCAEMDKHNPATEIPGTSFFALVPVCSVVACPFLLLLLLHPSITTRATLSCLQVPPGHGWCSLLYQCAHHHSAWDHCGFLILSFFSLVSSRTDEDFSDRHIKKAHAQKPKRKHEPNFLFRLDHWTRVKTYMSRGQQKARSGAQVGQSQGRVIGNGPMGELCYAADAPIMPII